MLPLEAIIGLGNQIFVFLLSGRLRQVLLYLNTLIKFYQRYQPYSLAIYQLRDHVLLFMLKNTKNNKITEGPREQDSWYGQTDGHLYQCIFLCPFSFKVPFCISDSKTYPGNNVVQIIFLNTQENNW